MINSYSKVNLNLKVIGKKNNLHNIESLVFWLDLCDKIIIKKNSLKIDRVSFTGKYKKFINNKNTVVKTLSLLRQLKYVSNHQGYNINIKKNIPVFSGLGGGSSNAAFLIRYFCKNKLKKRDLKTFQHKVSSDIILFLFGPKILQRDIYSVQNIKTKLNLHFVLIYPGFKCETKKIYAKVRKYSFKSKFFGTNRKTVLDFAKSSNNDLENIAIKFYPKLKKIINFLQNYTNCEFSRLSGSGSTCFAVFKTRKNALIALKKIKRNFPQYSSVLAKSI